MPVMPTSQPRRVACLIALVALLLVGVLAVDWFGAPKVNSRESVAALRSLKPTGAVPGGTAVKKDSSTEDRIILWSLFLRVAAARSGRSHD